MQADLGDLGPPLALLLAVILLLPKRGWRSFSVRLRATARGERRYVIGPPAGSGALSSDFVERWLQVVRRELPRALDLGLPLYMIAQVVEAAGRQHRRHRAAVWAGSPGALFCAHLSGALSDEDLLDRLRAAGHPLPASKLRWSRPATVSLPPTHWRQEWEQSQVPEAGADPDALSPPRQPAVRPSGGVVQPAAAMPAGSHTAAAGMLPPALEIQTLGTIRISAGGVDYAPGFLRRRTLAFTWLYMLLLQTLQPEARVTRAKFSDELFPAMDDVRKRLSGRLNEMRSDLPQELSQRIQTEGEFLWLDLDGCSFDAHWVLGLAGRVARQQTTPLTSELLDQAERAVQMAAKEFLPGWEEIERRGSDRRSAAAGVVEEVRAGLAGAQLRLVEGIAKTYAARRQSGQAIPYLEDALRQRPDREELAHLLVDAFDSTEQPGRAQKLREEYGFESRGSGSWRTGAGKGK